MQVNIQAPTLKLAMVERKLKIKNMIMVLLLLVSRMRIQPQIKIHPSCLKRTLTKCLVIKDTETKIPPTITEVKPCKISVKRNIAVSALKKRMERVEVKNALMRQEMISWTTRMIAEILP